MALKNRPGRRIATLLAGLTLLALAGCKEETISRYQVPKPPPQRLLGVIVSHGERTWFFKLVGPQEAVDKHADEFKLFIDSVRFPASGEQPITWTVPRESGWREQGGTQLRYATILLGSKDTPLELTVVPLEGAGGSLLKNVNRWREQMKLPDISGAELTSLTRAIKVDGNQGTWVDIKSGDQPGRGGSGAKP